MPSAIVEQFMSLLQDAERTRDPALLARLFAEKAELSKPGRAGSRKAARGVRRFWLDYLKPFGEIRSEFTRVTEGDDWAALEWISRGFLADGTPIDYCGVSVLEFQGDRITAFRSYYDSAAILKPRPQLAG